ncbi:conserved hypothetical protein, secreted [sediment metagenome]|uniref:Uncharacterized protein n=1 Tax=sediment metagenome TaxID=749907 RepID=D9PJI7_9ZZZZ
MRKTILLFLFILSFQNLFSQAQESIRALSGDPKFLDYLIQKGNFEDVIYIIEEILPGNDSLRGDINELNYYLGYAQYNLKNLQKSSESFLKVSPASVYYNKSRFFAAYNSAFGKDYKLAKGILKDLQPGEELLKEFSIFQQSGISLLERDYKSFDSLSYSFSKNYYQFASEEDKLIQYSKELADFKPKSVAISGVFSAIIPGMGKVYSKKAGEGVAAFLANSILLGMTYENYKKAGSRNYKTLIFGSLFSVFYIGNIYGSMVSVKVYREEFYKNYENKILFTMHIPLRTIFN